MLEMRTKLVVSLIKLTGLHIPGLWVDVVVRVGARQKGGEAGVVKGYDVKAQENPIMHAKRVTQEFLERKVEVRLE